MLLDDPILTIIGSLKYTIKENIDSLTEAYKNVVGGQYYFNLAEHISINWGTTHYFYEMNAEEAELGGYAIKDEQELFKSTYLDDENKINKILLEFQKQWKIVFNKIDSDYYSIKFQSYQQFDKFRKYTISVSNSPDSGGAIKGDVLNIIEHYNFANNIVEIKLSKVFDIPNPLAIILGLRIDYNDN